MRGTQRGEHKATDAPSSAFCGVKTTLLPAPAAQPRQGVGGSTASPPTLCTFCGDVLGAGDAPTSLYLQSPLPHSLLSVPSLLQALGVAPVGGTSQATVCQECQTLLHEGDEAYHHLLQVTASMRRRWPVVPPGSAAAATTWGGRKVRPILPKPLVAPDTAVACDLCWAVPGDWRTHAAVHHRLGPRWRSSRLLAALRACLAEELRWGSGRRGARRCPACPYTCPQRKDFVEHLQQHHRVAAGHGLLAPLGRAEGQEQGQGQGMAGQQQGDGEAAGLVEGRVDVLKGEKAGFEEVSVVKEEEEEEEPVQNILLATAEEAKDVVTVKQAEDRHWDGRLDQCVLGQDVAEAHGEAEGDSVEEQQEAGHTQDMCLSGPGGDGAQGQSRGSQWRCRVCAATFTSQQDHDLHKAASHPGSVRVGRSRTRPAPAPSPSQGGAAASAGDHQSQECLQEGAIVIMEGDGCGSVTHRRLEPPQGTLPQPGGVIELVCGPCGEVFGNRPALVRHQRAAHPGVAAAGDGGSEVLVECPLCGRRVSGLPALRLHQARVHGRPTQPPQHYRCRLCLAQCHTRAQLERHMRERHGAPPPPPPVRCDQCGKTYSARYIDVHVANMHGDAGRFPCTFCPMRFGVRASLRAHVSLEHANTTWACQECSLQFAKYHQLRQHRLYVHSRAEHRCPECPRSFKRRCDLTEHAKRRHRERPARECSFCPKVYSDRKRLRMHLMRKHGVAWEDTLAQGYACRQRENNCLRRRQQQQQPRSPRLPLRQQHQAAEGVAGEAVAVLGEEQPEYSVVELTEAPHPLTDTISYIILEEA